MKYTGIWLGSVCVTLITLSLMAGLAFYKYRQIQASMSAPPPPEQPITVDVAKAEAVTFRQKTTMIGTVLAARSITLSNEIAGTVSAVYFEPGMVVDQGQVLVELDTSVERAQREAAKARLTIAKTVFDRIREAAQTRAVTPSELDEATAQLSQANAEVDELNAIIERKTLKAPFRCRVGLSDTHEGQFLPSGTLITSLQSIDDFVYVDFMIPQSASDAVHVGQPVQLVFQDQPLSAEVSALDAQADRQSRNRMARAILRDHPDYLVPGESVKVIIEYGPEQMAAAVPVEALQSAPMQTFVYVVSPDPDGSPRAHERPVAAGPTIDDWLVVLSGISAGESVATDGSFKLREGALINPLTPAHRDLPVALRSKADPQ
jgi:membrane fusion protein (multidrug efflux system)